MSPLQGEATCVGKKKIRMRACFRAPLCCHSRKIPSQKRAYSILSSAGSTHHNENGVTRDSRAELGVGQLTGRGNRRPEVIRDVTKQKEEVHLQWERMGCPHTVLAGQLTKGGQEKSSARGTSWKSLTKVVFFFVVLQRWSINICSGDS